MDARQHALKVLALSRNGTERLLEDIPEDKLVYQPVPAANHALWVIGHLTWADDLFADHFDHAGRRIPESYAKLFGTGSKPVNDAAAYPPPAEVRRHFAAARKRLIEGVTNATQEVLDEPLPEGFGDFAPNKIALLFSTAWHEGVHAGQLTVIRKSLGMAPKFG